MRSAQTAVLLDWRPLGGTMADFRRPFRAPPIRKRPANVLQFEPHARKRNKDQRKSWGKANWAIALLIISPAVGVGAAWVWNAKPNQILPLAAPIAEQYEVTFARCDGPSRSNCVVDGDTFWLEGAKIRIADINTPEISDPQCAAERELGERATARLVELLNSGGFSLRPVDRDTDSYGRKLRIVTRGGKSLGALLVNEGLAERWSGSRRNWC